MALTPPQVVPAPTPRGLRYGLLAAAAGPLNLEPSGRGGGLVYEPVSCGSARRYPIECDDTPPAKVFDQADSWTEADPFVVYSTLTCGTAGNTLATIEAKVRQRLANGEQTAAEAEFAVGLAADATPLTAEDPTSLWAVVGELEQWLYGTGTANYGNAGYLHAPIRYAALAAGAGLTVKDGPLLRTVLGTVWVFGGGYPDDGQVYITGHTTVWRAEDVVVPSIAQTLNRTTNQYYALAEREYAVTYDCVAAAAAFTPELPGS